MTWRRGAALLVATICGYLAGHFDEAGFWVAFVFGAIGTLGGHLILPDEDGRQ